MIKIVFSIFTIIISIFSFELYACEVKEGLGKAQLPDNSIYEGEFKDCLFNGEGKLTWRDGSVYEGMFYNGLQHGFGKKIYSDGSVFEGTYINGIANGKRKHTYTDGTYYEGEYKDGIFTGKGKFISENGDVYEGKFKNGLIHGKGAFIYNNGVKVNATYENGHLSGQDMSHFPYEDQLEKLFFILIGFVLAQMPGIINRKRKLKTHFAALRAEINVIEEKSKLYLEDNVMSPLYRFPTESFKTSYPVLLVEGVLNEEEIHNLSLFHGQVQDINRGFDNSAAALANKDNDRMADEFKRCRNQIKTLISGEEALYIKVEKILNDKIKS